MPQIEVLPNSTTTSAPGWAYVPDTGYDPSKAAIVPSGARKKRASGFGSSTSGSAAASTARQQNKVVKQLAALDRENHRDVVITVQHRSKDVGSRSMRGHKMTAGVKKILLSQKTFANHLADEEAHFSSSASSAPVQQQLALSTPPPTATAVPSSSDAPQTTEPPTPTHPLHVSPLPPLPTEAELAALVAAPPLSYNAARAGPSASSAPLRTFCDMCGFWGRVKCMRCGARVCGLECKKAHEEARCLKFYG